MPADATSTAPAPTRSANPRPRVWRIQRPHAASSNWRQITARPITPISSGANRPPAMPRPLAWIMNITPMPTAPRAIVWNTSNAPGRPLVRSPRRVADSRPGERSGWRSGRNRQSNR